MSNKKYQTVIDALQTHGTTFEYKNGSDIVELRVHSSNNDIVSFFGGFDSMNIEKFGTMACEGYSYDMMRQKTTFKFRYENIINMVNGDNIS